MSSVTSLTGHEQDDLRQLARDSIRHGLTHGKALDVNASDYSDPLQRQRATFVTLELGGTLRGCIGTLEAHRPLAVDVASNAYAAAFSDPRFPPLDENEFQRLDIHISILTPSEPLLFNGEEDLLEKIRPGIDGLILSEGYRRGTFLPSVWESLPNPEQFLQHLKLKAGLPADYWSDQIEIERYTTELIE
nr:AmmeMemoRadiSam system protein A [Candidatus Reidiella endopervernicosa]